ncbi:MAG: site-specific DNA-methyltransferase [Actinobacteria bacterium]|nr:site-specific DNA-methyltransferase [Actinomycetota bacterium]
MYCAKPGRKEKELGCEALPPRTGAEATFRQEDTAGLNNLRAGAGRTAETIHNWHPTVKPISLMRWLVRLLCPPEGVLVDPFVGSGTTAIAAVLEGRTVRGLEQSPEYFEIAAARLAHWTAPKTAPEAQLKLF